MKLQEIREQIAYELENDINNWSDVIDNTNPGNYGLEDWNKTIPHKGLWIDIPSKTFKFKDADFFAKLVLGASKGDSSFTHDYNKTASGEGTFEFISKTKIAISSLEIEIDSEIFD
jgi:hypothetical protein